MPNWGEVEREAPELAAAVQARFDAYRHKVLGTLRTDGSPRLSGLEATFRDGELWLGMMPDSRKALDLRRDPRMALHSATVDPEMLEGDARITGRAVEVTDGGAMEALVKGDDRHGAGAPAGHVFRVEVAEVMLIKVGDPADHLVIETWHEGRGVERMSAGSGRLTWSLAASPEPGRGSAVMGLTRRLGEPPRGHLSTS